MVELFATIVVNSLLSTRSLCPSIPSVARMVMHHTLPPDFFIPHSPLSKGKGKARESVVQEYSLRVSAASSSTEDQGSPNVRHYLNNWKRGCLSAALNGTGSRRDRSFRRHPSHHLPHPMYCQSPPTQLPLDGVQTRHVSNVPERKPSLIRHQTELVLETFRTVTNAPGDDRFDIEAAWEAYVSVIHCDARDSLTPAELFAFLTRMVGNAEKYYHKTDCLDDLHLWGDRLRDLLISVQSRTLSPPDELTRQCLLARACALLGRLKEALSFARSISKDAYGDEGQILPLWEAIVLSKMRHHGLVAVLDLVVVYWDFLGPFLNLRAVSLPSRRESFRRTVYTLLTSIHEPAVALWRRRSWSEERKRRAGELLIEVLCHQHLPEDAYAVLEEMRRLNLSVPPALQLGLVRALVRADSFERANHLFLSLSDSLPSGRDFKFHLSTGLYLFAHQGNISRVKDYSNRIQTQFGWVSSTDQAMIMYAHAVLGETEEVVDLFHRFFPRSDTDSQPLRPATSLHYNVVIFAHARRGDFDGMNLWLEIMSKAGIRPDAYVYNMILKGFAMRGEVHSVSVVLNQMRAAGIQPNHISYTSVITLLAHRQDPMASEAIYRRAMRDGVVPDRRMITALMNAHVEAGSWRGVIRAFDYMASSPTRHIRLSIEVYNTLLKAYVLIGAPFSVISDLFIKLENANIRPDTYSFALLIQSACDAGEMDAASDILTELEKRASLQESHIQVTVFALTIMMAGYLRRGNRLQAKAVYDSMIERGIQPTSVTYGSILKAYSNAGTEESLQLAEKFIETLVSVKPSQRPWDKPMDGRASALEMVYRPLMNAYARQEKPEEVVRLLQNMVDAGGEPTIGILTALLDAYRRTYDIGGVLQIWPQIFQLALRFSQVDSLFDDENLMVSGGVRRQANLLCVPLSIYIDAASAAGLHLEIAGVWKQLRVHGFTFDSHNWNHLTVALIRGGQPERAFDVIEKVILPYQQRSEHLRRTRDTNPVTPLLFQMSPKEDDTVPEPHSESLRRSTSRLSAVETSTRKAAPWLSSGNENPDDFAHPLHILQQISPSWDIWRPHGTTLRVLLMVLRRLESGSTIPAVSSYQDAEQLENDPERMKKNRELAREILDRIFKNCPKAVRAVQDFEASGNRRSPFDGLYG